MAWTAQVAAKEYKNGVLTVIVEYTDGAGNKFTQPFDLSGGNVEGAKTQVRSRLAQLAASDSLAASIPIGFNNFTAATQTIPATQDFSKKLQTYISCRNAVNLGFIAESDQVYIDAKAAAIAAFDPAYLTLGMI